MKRPSLESSTVAERALIGRLYSQYGTRLRAALDWRIAPEMRPRFDAEDILQETLLRAIQKWSAIADLPPYSWVYRLALDCLAEACRHEKRAKRNVARGVPMPDRSSLQFAAGLVHSSISPSQRAERAEQFDRITETIANMRPEDREVLFMRHVDGLSSAEIADILSVDVQCVHNRYAKAMMRLRKLAVHDEPNG